MTKAEKKVRNAMQRLNQAFAELHEERGIPYNGYFSACRIDDSEEETIYYNIFGNSADEYSDNSYTWRQKK